MAVKLSLRIKGLIIIGIFAMCSTFVAVALTHMLREAESESVAYEQSTAASAKATSILTSVSKAGTSLAFYAYTGQPEMAKKYEELTATIPGDINEMIRVVPKDRLEKATKMMALVKAIVGQMSDYKHRLDLGDDTLAVNQNRRQLQTELMHVAQDLNQFIEDEREHARQLDIASTKRMREQMQTATNILFLISAFAACVMMTLFTNRIAGRIEIITENARRLGRGETLSPAVSGNDEIAYLDNTFHRMAEELRQAQRLKQDFMAMVSHDLRSPLTSIQGSLMLITHGAAGAVSEKAMEILDTAEGEMKRLTRLICDLLDSEKMEAGEMQIEPTRFHVSSIVWRSISSVQNLADTAGVKFDVGDCEQEVIADEERMVQVLVNLFSNAIKFAPAGSAVRIEASLVQSDRVEVRVIDHGPGIPADQLNLIFDKYHQVRAADSGSRSGTGLGLAICKQIVEQHGGRIGVISKLGQGSTFWLQIPAPKSADTQQ